MIDRIVVLGTVCSAALVLPLSFSAGAMATPAIGRDLGGSNAAQGWITNAFMLAFGSLLLAAGTLADRYGRKRVFTAGLGLFVLTSVALSASPTVLAIDLLRAGQGIAAAAALAGGTAALAQEFEGEARTKAFSMLGATFGAGLAFGPLLAALVIEHLGWRSVFLPNAVVGGLALLFGVPRMRESRDPLALGLDWAGTATWTGALTLFTFGVIEAPSSGWSSPLVLLVLAGAVAMFSCFIAVERRVDRPMLDLTLFRYPRFVGVQVLPIATCFSYVVLLVLLPLRFMGVEGVGGMNAGLLMVVLSAPVMLVPFLAAVLTRWASAGVIAGTGLLMAAGGLLWLRQSLGDATGHTVVLPLLVIGMGTGLPWGLMDGLSLSVVPKERAGMATGIFSTTRVAGEGIALAVVIAVLSAFVRGRLSEHLSGATLETFFGASEAAQSLAIGNLDRAISQLPDVGRPLLVRAYSDAFGTLLVMLSGVTAVSASVVLAFLHRTNGRAEITAPRVVRSDSASDAMLHVESNSALANSTSFRAELP